MNETKPVFRPSSISRYTNCNLWRWLPQKDKTPEQLAYLQERTNDHSRLEEEKFLASEEQCKEYFLSVKNKCLYFFKEKTLEIEIDGEFLQGTPDVYGYDEESKTLHIIDYKTGRSYVTAENNDQLLAYALLAMETHDDWKIDTIKLAILNTQHDGVNRHTYMGRTYIDKLKARIEKAIDLNRSEHSFGKPGSWCHFCPAKRYCLRKKGYRKLKDYADLDTDRLILEAKVRSAEMLSREKEVKSGVYSKLLTPLVEERSKTQWNQEQKLPDKFFIKKTMSVTDAKERFALEEIEPYLKKSKCIFLRKKNIETHLLTQKNMELHLI